MQMPEADATQRAQVTDRDVMDRAGDAGSNGDWRDCALSSGDQARYCQTEWM